MPLTRFTFVAVLCAMTLITATVQAQRSGAAPGNYLHRTMSNLPPKLDAFSPANASVAQRQPMFTDPPLPRTGSTYDTALGSPLEFDPGQPPVYDPLLEAPDPYGLAPTGLSEHKDGFFQKLDFQGTWIDSPSGDDFSVYSLQTSLSVAVPLLTRESPLLITPGFGVHYFDGPVAPHVPPRVYDAYLSLLWLRPLTSQTKAVLEVKPGIYGDLQQLDSDSLRIQGKALLLYDNRPGVMQLVMGVAYLDRDDISLLPVGGVIWTPTPAHRYELIFPQPKLSYRLDYWYDWDPTESFEDWLYFRAAFGGDQWEYEQLDGTRNVFLLRDYRLIVGLERKRNGGGNMRLEAGYVFGRTLEFAAGLPDVAGDPALFVRGGVTF